MHVSTKRELSPVAASSRRRKSHAMRHHNSIGDTRVAVVTAIERQNTHLVFDEGGEREVVEEVGEVSPYVRISVLSETFIVESVYLCDLPRFVVSAEDGDSIAVSELECNEEGYSLDRVVPSVNIVPHEEVIGVRRVAADPEEF